MTKFIKVAEQDWFEGGKENGYEWQSCGWYTTDEETGAVTDLSDGWEVIEVLDTDKHGHPIKAVMHFIGDQDDKVR